MKCQTLFCRKNVEKSTVSSAEFAHSMVHVSINLELIKALRGQVSPDVMACHGKGL